MVRPSLGYTGKASAEELETLKKERDDYSTDDIIGKTGVEQLMETQLLSITPMYVQSIFTAEE